MLGTQPIFHLLALGVGVGGSANFSVRVGGNPNFSVFRYQHVGIGNVKLWRWGSKPTRGPNANGFASQWIIGYRGIVLFTDPFLDLWLSSSLSFGCQAWLSGCPSFLGTFIFSFLLTEFAKGSLFFFLAENESAI